MKIILIFLLPTFLPLASMADELTLCHPHEEVYFSCPIGKKIASVCASGNITPDSGYVQYRFGQPDKIELEYPSKPYPPRDHFSISDIHAGNLNVVHLKFKSGPYDYVVFQGTNNGVYVKKNGKTIANLFCEEQSYGAIVSRAFRGIPTVPQEDDIDN